MRRFFLVLTIYELIEKKNSIMPSYLEDWNTLANSEELAEMPHNAAFRNGVARTLNKLLTSKGDYWIKQ